MKTTNNKQRIMNNEKYIKKWLPLFIFHFSLFILMSSCVKVELHDTVHPDKGQITLTTDWTNRGAGIAVPAGYTVVIDGQTLNYTQATNVLPLLNPGTYPTHIYNTADKISISGATATVQTTGTIVDNNPGWLFTAALDITAVADRADSYTAVMQQQVRQLTIELTVTEGDPERIATTSASLSGIANAVDYTSNVHSGSGLSVVPVFTRTGDKLTAVVRLLGTTTEAQNLTLDITFTDGRAQQIVSGISTQLSGFNADKKTPLTISGNLNTPIEVGVQGTINGWTNTPNGSGTAW